MESLPGSIGTSSPDPLSVLARESMRVSESRYRRLFETALDGILLLNADTAQIEDVNPYLIAMLGYSHVEFLGKKLWEVGAFGDVAQSKEMFAEIQTNGFVRYENLPLRTVSGSLIQVEFVSNSYDCDGVKVIQCNIRDITERKKAEKELSSLNIELEQFAYVASHDLRQPLRMISNYLRIIEERLGPKLSGDLKTYFDFAVDGAKRMDRLITDLLEYSRTGKPSNNISVAVGDAVANALINLTLLIRESGVEISVSDHLPTVNGDPGELSRLFQNLIGNAIKYRHPDRRPAVCISCHSLGEAWRFAVADNGIGIENKHHDRIFGIFQRLHARDHYEGTGIGLSICRKIVTRHEGTIWVESVFGKGSTFYFTIPKIWAGKEPQATHLD